MLLWWEDGFGWSRGELTGAYTLSMLVAAGFSPIVGRIIDQGRGSAMMGCCTAIAGVAVAGISLVTELWQFYMIWVLIGIMNSGALYEPCFALITRARGLGAKRSIIAITLVAGFASTISFPSAHLLSTAFGWKVAVQIFGAVAVFVAAPLMYTGARAIEANPTVSEEPVSPTTPKESQHGHAHRFLARPEFWFLGLAFACGAMLQQMTISHFLAIMASRNVAIDIAVLAASFIGPMQVLGRLTMVATERFASNHLVAICSFSAMGISSIFLMNSGNSLGFVAGFAIFFGGAHGVVSIIKPMLTYEILGKQGFGAKAGALASLFFIGGALAPFAGSIIWQQGGYDTVLMFLLVLALTGLVLYLLARWQKNRNLV